MSSSVDTFLEQFHKRHRSIHNLVVVNWYM